MIPAKLNVTTMQTREIEVMAVIMFNGDLVIGYADGLIEAYKLP
jgi:hypothetical protein